MKKSVLCLFTLCVFTSASAKELALTFDDVPIGSTAHYDREARAKELIEKLRKLGISGAMIFTNPCRSHEGRSALDHIQLYRDAGHEIANHSCRHPRLDDVGFEAYAKDVAEADTLLRPLMNTPKFFRFPFLNEGEIKVRDQMRAWLTKNGYRSGSVTLDNDDYFFSTKLNEAKQKGKTIDYKKIEALFLDHVVGAAEFYNDLAVKTLGYSPKHSLLLHEMDATVMYLEPLVAEFRRRGWRIIAAREAYTDKIYNEQPRNTYAGNGLIAQLHREKTGRTVRYKSFEELKAALNEALGL